MQFGVYQKKERKRERKKERLVKFQKTICGDQYISDILLSWLKGFKNDDGGEIFGSLSKYNDEEQ